MANEAGVDPQLREVGAADVSGDHHVPGPVAPEGRQHMADLPEGDGLDIEAGEVRVGDTGQRHDARVAAGPRDLARDLDGQKTAACKD